MELTLKFNSCWAGIYDNFYSNEEEMFQCTLETYRLHDLLNVNFMEWYGSWYVNTCDRDAPGWIKSRESGGARFAEEDWPEITDLFAGSGEEEVEQVEIDEEPEEEVIDENEEVFEEEVVVDDDFGGNDGGFFL